MPDRITAGYFYPRSPRGERRRVWVSEDYYHDFYPRSPRGERLSATVWSVSYISYFYPRSPRGERLISYMCMYVKGFISIRAPREGSDKSHMMEQMEQMIFLSALPARGATVAVQPSWIV